MTASTITPVPFYFGSRTPVDRKLFSRLCSNSDQLQPYEIVNSRGLEEVTLPAEPVLLTVEKDYTFPQFEEKMRRDGIIPATLGELINLLGIPQFSRSGRHLFSKQSAFALGTRIKLSGGQILVPFLFEYPDVTYGLTDKVAGRVYLCAEEDGLKEGHLVYAYLPEKIE